MLLCIINTALAVEVNPTPTPSPSTTSGLLIDHMEITIDGETDDISHGDIIDVSPGSSLSLRVELSNTLINTDIEDIEVEGVILDIDNGDDIETETIEEFDLEDQDSVEFDVNFAQDIPFFVEEDTFDLELFISGTAQTGEDIQIVFDLTVSVDKANNELVIQDKLLTPSTVSCGESSTLSFTVINVGTNDEENISLHLTSSDLGLDNLTEFNLNSGDDESEISVALSHVIATSSSLSSTTYPVTINLTYDEGDESLIETIDLNVSCPQVVQPTTSTSSLRIKDVDAFVSGDKESARLGGTVDVEPGDSFKLKVEIENTGSLEIEDIEVEGAILSIDDEGDDDNEADEPSEFDLKPGKDKKVTINFDDIPLLVEDGDYDLELVFTGTDVNNTEVSTSLNMTITVEKDKHLLIFERIGLSPDTVECGQSTSLALNLVNIGEEDEDEIQLKVSSAGLDFEQTSQFDLQSGDDPSEVRESKQYTITVGEDVSPGSYPVTVRATYDEGDEVVESIVPLTVTQCVVEPTTIEETVVVDDAADVEDTAGAVDAQDAQSDDEEEKESTNNSGIAIIVLLYVLVLGVGGYGLFYVLKR